MVFQKLAAIWIILEYYYLDSIWIILAFRIILFYLAFHQKINKPNIHNNINGGISRFQNELNELPSRTGYYSNSQSYEGSHEGKFFLLIFEHFSQNAYFWGCDIFFLPSGYPINSIFPWQCIFIRSCFCGELSHINMHDTSMEWSCRVTWQTKYISTCRKCMHTKLVKVLT